MREAQDAKTKALEMGVAGSVTLECGAVAVMAEAIGFDDQTSVAPEEIHLVRADACIDLWLGKAVAAAEAEHELLQLASRQLLLLEVG
jgi:hypothetical protein